MSGGRGLCAGFRAGECGACVLARVRRSLAVGARSFPERRRRRRGPDSSTAPHRNSPWSDRRGLAGGAAEQQPRRVSGDRSPRAAAALSGPSAASPHPRALLVPRAPKVASETLHRERDFGPQGPLPPTHGNNSGSCGPGSSAGPARPVSAQFASANSGSASKDISCPVQWLRGAIPRPQSGS